MQSETLLRPTERCVPLRRLDVMQNDTKQADGKSACVRVPEDT